ncbi:MAG: hypothetical protein D6798_14140, partial [Deltaproteobacteria bacterium]
MSEGRPGRRTGLRRAARGVGILLVGATLSVTGVGLFLTTEAGNRVLLRLALGRINAGLDQATLTVGALHTDLWDGVVLRQIALHTHGGETLVAADRAVVTWDLVPLLQRRLAIPQVRLDRPVVDLRTDPATGRLALLDALGLAASEPDDAPPTPWGGLDGALDVASIEVRDGTVRFDGGEVDDLQVDGRL